MSAPICKRYDSAAQLCLLQTFICCSPHSAGRSSKRCKHMVTSHIVALRTWHVGELCERTVLPQVLPAASAPYIRLCSHADSHQTGLDLLSLETVHVFWVPLRACPPVVIFWLGVSLIKARTCPRHSSGRNSDTWSWRADTVSALGTAEVRLFRVQCCFLRFCSSGSSTPVGFTIRYVLP